MAHETLNGLSAMVNIGDRGTLVTTGALNPNAWYEVNAVGGSTALPAYAEETTRFKTPDTTATAITLASGDEVYPLTDEQLCKTDMSISTEKGVLDVTDDCGDGSVEKVLDGVVDIKGTLGGFTKFDAVTGKIKDMTKTILQKFFNFVEDDGEGTYTFTAKDDNPLIVSICLNKDAAAGEFQNWLLIPIIITSANLGAGIREAQKRELSWEKGQGQAYLYQRLAFAADVL